MMTQPTAAFGQSYREINVADFRVKLDPGSTHPIDIIVEGRRYGHTIEEARNLITALEVALAGVDADGTETLAQRADRIRTARQAGEA